MAKEVRKTFYDKDFVPKNLEELYNSGWKEYMLYHIKKYSLRDINHSPQDLLHDMMIQLAITGYLDNYDPNVSEFTVYLHTFIKNFMSKPYNKEHKTVNGGKIVNAVPIVATDVDSVDNPDVVTYDTIGSSDGDFTEYLCLSQTLEADLESIKSKSKVDYNGKVLKRTPSTVYKLLQAGYDVKEIAEIFGTSKQFVYTLRNKIIGVVRSYA